MALIYPFEGLPAPGHSTEVAPGVFWLRMPLPFALDHINLWLIEDGEGWAVVDTGIRGRHVKALWEQVFAERLGGRPVTRVIVTHYHPDHVGQAGWLCAHWNAPLWMTRTEFLLARTLILDVRDEPPPEAINFYHRAGYDAAMVETYRLRGYSGYSKSVTRMPVAFRRMVDGETFAIGGRAWQVVVGRGHAPEHACLWCPDLGVMISGDQVLPRISSNVSVHPTEPDADPLTEWLDSLSHVRHLVPADTLVLPAHNEPFRGLHARVTRLLEGHERRLIEVANFCDQPRTALEAMRPMFRRTIDDSERGLAIGETLAHLHCLRTRGVLVRQTNDEGVDTWIRAAA